MTSSPFSVAEVEALIPALEGHFLCIFQIRAALRRQEHALAHAGVHLSRAALTSDDVRQPADVRRAKAVFRGYWSTLDDQITAIERLGGQIKDLEQGLVDFPSRRGGDRILLCWRMGEKKVAYLHPVEAGFASRQPIDDQIPRQPPALD